MTDTNTPSNVVTLQNGEPSWIIDIRRHAKLVQIFSLTAKLQKELAKRMKSCETSPEGYDCLKTLSPDTRLRMAMRFAVKSVRKEEVAPSASDVLLQEYAYQSKQQKKRRAEIIKLESRVLTAQPKTTKEVKLLLKFISALIASGRKIESRYLADALEECMFTISKASNAAQAHIESGPAPTAGVLGNTSVVQEIGG